MKTIHLFAFIGCFVFCHPICYAQKINIDSFYNVVSQIDELEGKRKKFGELRSNNYLSQRLTGVMWLKEMERLFEDDRFQEVSYRLIRGDILGASYTITEDFPKVIEENLQSARLYIKTGLGTPRNIAIHFSEAGKYFQYEGSMDSALLYLEKANYLNELHDLALWNIAFNRASLFVELRNFQKANECFMDGFNMLKKERRRGQIGYYLYRVCTYYYDSGNNPEMLSFYLSELDKFQAGKPLAPPSSHYPLLDFLYAPPIDTTIRRLTEALNYNRDRSNFSGSNIISRTLANAYGRKKQYSMSIRVIEDQLSVLTDTLYPYDGHLFYDDLQRYYNLIGNKNAAYDAVLLSMKYRNLFVDQRVQETVSEAQIKYETERKEKELAQRNVELAQANQERNLLIVGGFGLLMAAGLLYRLASIRRKNNMTLMEKNSIISKANEEKDNLLKEIHHRIKNNLQIVSSLLSLQSSKTDSQDARVAIDDGRNRVQSMALLHQNLFIDVDRAQVNTKEYIPKLANHIYESYSPIAKGVEMNVDIDSMDLDVDTIVPIGLIINELITNAMKYAFVDSDGGKLDIVLRNLTEEILIEITDNGIGKAQSQEKSKRVGIGSQLIESFCEKLNATNTVSSENGTRVSIRIPKLAA